MVSEVALALLLLLGAGLTMKSLVGLWRVHPGFAADGVLTVTARFPFYGTGDVTTRAALYRQARAWIQELSPAVVWDLFCGVGGFALNAAAPGRSVLGVELS